MELTTEEISEKTGVIAGDIGRGLVAGLAGTAVLTLAQVVDMKVTDRQPSDSPVQAVKKVLGVQPTDEDHKKSLTSMIHLTYGTVWGLARALIKTTTGLKTWQADIAHLGAVWGTALIMLPSLKVAPPVKQWGWKEIVKDGILHAVYSIAAGFVFDKLYQYSCDHRSTSLNYGTEK